jgi:hypothetical protein
MSQSSSKNRSQKFWQAFELLKKRKAAARSGQKCTLRPDKGLLVAGGTSGHFTVVDFDVSVVAENKAGGKGGLKVWGVGIEGEAGHSSQHTSRVRFSVHLQIPQGAKAPDTSYDRDVEDSSYEDA